MVKTRTYGNLYLIGNANIRKVGGYNRLENLMLSEGIDYEKDSISSSFPKFGGGEVYRTEDGKIIITSYSRGVNPRFLPIKEIYVYRLYVMSENDFEKVKSKLNFTPLSN